MKAPWHTGEEAWPVQVDPPGCGCTECMIGEYVPADRATADQLWAAMTGKLHDASSLDWKAVLTDGVRAQRRD